MELVRENGSVIELKEGQRRELGRAIGERDASVSRMHVIVELLRPASRKGKEAMGESPALQLHVQVMGRNPICVVGGAPGAEDRRSPRIKFVARGNADWLAVGDKFTLSIRRPAFLSLERWPGERNSNGGSGEKSPGSGTEPVDAEEEIARAVARRERRSFEREQQRKRLLSEQMQKPENCVRPANSEAASEAKAKASSPGEAAAEPGPPTDPASEFGFVVEGSEFEMYEKQGKANNLRAWSWKIDKNGGDDDDDECKSSTANRKETKGPGKRAKEDEDDDDEWGGDDEDEEQRVDKVKERGGAKTVATRSRRPTQKGIIMSPKKAAREREASADMSDFIVDSSETDEGEDEDEIFDEVDLPIAQNAEKRSGTSGTVPKPACKYGSSCYRKNKEHLSQFSHPER